MTIPQLKTLGPWSCPLCGFYESHGVWLHFHFQMKHGMTEKEARAALVRCSSSLSVVAPVVAPVIPVPSVVHPRGQLDLFDKRCSLVG